MDIQNLIRDVLVAALKCYAHDRAVRETIAVAGRASN